VSIKDARVPRPSVPTRLLGGDAVAASATVANPRASNCRKIEVLPTPALPVRMYLLDRSQDGLSHLVS
jgi:hypothetical protein